MTNHPPGEEPWIGPDRTVKEEDMTLDNEQIVRKA
jgi:hypothetical protein